MIHRSFSVCARIYPSVVDKRQKRLSGHLRIHGLLREMYINRLKRLARGIAEKAGLSIIFPGQEKIMSAGRVGQDVVWSVLP